MDEFNRLQWPVADVGTDLSEAYTLNLADYQKTNPTDVFLCNLKEIDPLHYRYIDQKRDKLNDADSQNVVTKQFIDPRTGVEIPSHECNHQTTTLESRNIFLKSFIQVSKLQKHEHLACLNALRCLKKHASELTIEQRTNHLLFESTSTIRAEEKCAYLEKLREHYFEKLLTRFHDVPPSIGHFILQNWKKQLIVMHRQMANVKYQIRTAVSLQPVEYAVKFDVFHQEHLGKLPKMDLENVDYLRQSYPYLMEAYHLRKNAQLKTLIREKINELVEEHSIEFVVPISVLKCLLNSKRSWCSLMSVKEPAHSTMFDSIKRIFFNKPMPPTYMSGNERYNKGAKYLIRSCLNRNSKYLYNHYDQIEQKINFDECAGEFDSVPNTNIEYKVSNIDEFTEKHKKTETIMGNMTFTIFNVTGRNDDNDEAKETLKILVPTKLDAYKKDEHDSVQFLNYTAKIEFQAEYGAEVMTKEELIREWCELYFRPQSLTERVRFDCVTGKKVHHQTISLNDVENELKSLHGIETQQLLQRLWHAFQTFYEFPVGDYFLQNDSKQTDYIKIYEKTENSSGNFDILESFKNVPFGSNIFEDTDWQPIDDKIVTDIHEMHTILPCAFPHSDHMKAHNVKPPTEDRRKPVKVANKSKKVRKINPKDDSYRILQKVRAKKTIIGKRKSVAKARKQIKRNKNREIKRTHLQAQKAEIQEHETAKQFLAATMDQYATLNGTPAHEHQEKNSMWTRTRKKSKCIDSEKNPEPIEAKTRRSSRLSSR